MGINPFGRPDKRVTFSPSTIKKTGSMKQAFSIAAVLLLMLNACSSPSADKSAEIKPADNTAAAAPVVVAVAPMPFPATQTDDWKMGDPEKLRMILTFYKNMVNDTNYADLANHVADTITNINFENKTYKLSPDGFSKLVKTFRSRFTKLDEEFRTYMVLHSDKLDYDQVMLWVKETGTYKNGKVDSTMYQENWRINREGKIFYRGSFMRY
jgi:hypothetical protein